MPQQQQLIPLHNTSTDNILEDSWLKQQTSARIKRGQPIFTITFGQRGSGKSRWAKTYAQAIVKWQNEIIKNEGVLTFDHADYDLSKATFTIRNIWYDTVEVNRTLSDALDLPPDDPFCAGQGDPYGSIEMIDEPMGVSAYDWMSDVIQAITDCITAGRISFKHVMLNAPHFNDIAASIRTLDPIVTRMWAPGEATLYRINSNLDGLWFNKIGDVGGRDPITGVTYKVPFIDDPLDLEMEQKKRYYFRQMVIAQREQRDRIRGTITKTGKMRGATKYTTNEKMSQMTQILDKAENNPMDMTGEEVVTLENAIDHIDARKRSRRKSTRKTLVEPNESNILAEPADLY